MTSPFDSLSAWTKEGLLNIVVDTPKWSRNKFKYDEEARCFRLSRILPAGASFPHDFGSIPKTRAEDGDALDALVICDAPSFVGCLMTGKLIGVISAEQTEQGKTIRNDRLIAVPVTPSNQALYADIAELPKSWLDEIEHFFVAYNAAHGRVYKPVGRGGTEQAKEAVAKAEKRYAAPETR